MNRWGDNRRKSIKMFRMIDYWIDATPKKVQEILIRFGWWIQEKIEHFHLFSLSSISWYPSVTHPECDELVAFIYKCKCGNEIVELTESGRDFIFDGLNIEELLENRF